MKCTDPELLLLKASSQTTLGCLEECLYALQLQQRAAVKTEASAGQASSQHIPISGKHNQSTSITSTFYVSPSPVEKSNVRVGSVSSSSSCTPPAKVSPINPSSR